MNNTREVLDHIDDERQRQDDRWGQQNCDDGTWALILGEEVGEAFQQALEDRRWPSERGQVLLREELVQVAAVAVAWIEALDRRVQ